ncbi:MAG: hypothetical protein APF77_15735 [Clostridia bacterium BRH_c25]|nr:MAG: hypothetical protein APF77_15735 [Clostridia bacterium BRH_c25]
MIYKVYLAGAVKKGCFFMAKGKNSMSEGKKNIIAALLQEYDIKNSRHVESIILMTYCGQKDK